MKVLVTGATGFLGGPIVRRLLADGCSVRALVRPGASLAIPGVEVVEGDVCDEASVRNAVSGVDAVVHAAARVDTKGKWEEFAEANIRGTQRVIRAAQRAGAQVIVHISSLSIYAVARDGLTVTEDSPYESESDSRGHYSRSKLAADRIALAEAGRGAPVVVLRPGLLYGPGKRPPLARQSFNVKGRRLILATRDYTLPMTYTDNVADAVALALHKPEAIGQAITLVDENIPQSRYIELFQAASGETWPSFYLPVDLVANGARVAEKLLRLARRRSPVTYHQVKRATRKAFFDTTRAQRILGWQPNVSVAEGLKRAFDSLNTSNGSTTVSP